MIETATTSTPSLTSVVSASGPSSKASVGVLGLEVVAASAAAAATAAAADCLKHGKQRNRTFHVLNNVKVADCRMLQAALCSCDKDIKKRSKTGGVTAAAAAADAATTTTEDANLAALVASTLDKLKEPLSEADQSWLGTHPKWNAAISRYVLRKLRAKAGKGNDQGGEVQPASEADLAAAAAAAAVAAKEAAVKAEKAKRVLIPMSIPRGMVCHVIGKRGQHLAQLARSNWVHISLQTDVPAAARSPRAACDVSHLYISSDYTPLTETKITTIKQQILHLVNAAHEIYQKNEKTRARRQEMTMQASQSGDIRRHGRNNLENVKILNRQKFERHSKPQQKPRKMCLIPYTFCRFCLMSWSTLDSSSLCACHPGFVTRNNTWSCCKSAVHTDAWDAADPLHNPCSNTPHVPKLMFPKDTLRAGSGSIHNRSSRAGRVSCVKQRQNLAQDLRHGELASDVAG